MESIKHILPCILFVVACNAQSAVQTTRDPTELTDADFFAGFIILLVIILCIVGGVCACILCCVWCCCKTAIKGLYNLICCPFRFSKWIMGKIFFCRGCNTRVGVAACTSIFNGAATFVMLLRMGIIVSVDPNEFVKNDMQKAFLIIVFILISFGIKAFRTCRANRRAKANTESENIQAEKVKDLQAMVISLSDTVFKFISAIAIFIGSSYSGTDDSNCDENICQSVVFEYIKWASFLGFSNELIEMFEQYLTMAIFFKEIKEEVEPQGFEFNMYKKNDDKKKEPKVESTQDIQKTILWQASGASIKMFVLLVEQILVLIAAIKLFTSDTDEKLWFMILVIVCCVIIIFTAFGMCIKFQRLSFGLCCKYYCCCFYKCCSEHCETKWIKLDPIENKDVILNHLGQVMLVVNTPAHDIGSDEQGRNVNTINPSLTVQQQQQQPHVAVQMHQMIQQSQVIQQPQSQLQSQQPQIIQVIQQPQPQSQAQQQMDQGNLTNYAQPQSEGDQGIVTDLVEVAKDGIDKLA